MNLPNASKQPALSGKQWIVILLVLAALAFWIGSKAASRLQVALYPPEPEKTAPLTVETWRLEPTTFERWVRYPGSIAAEREAVLQSRLTAQILDLPVRSGQRVQRGDLLVRLEDDELGNELARLQAAAKAIEAEILLAQKQLQRRRQLFASAAATEEQVDEARTRGEALQASREENRHAIGVAESKRSYARIEAPFDGVVGRLFALPGDLAAPGRALVELVDTGALKAVFSIPQQDVARIARGTRARIHIPVLDLVLEGEVDRLHPSLQPPARGAQAEIVLNGPTRNLMPGMEAVIRLRIEHHEQVLVIPVEALHRRAGQAHVFVLEENRARRRAVISGPEFEGRLLIEEGLATGDVLILTPHPELSDGRFVLAGDAR